jgi:co-chaperonin GroES (HSP10)
MHREFLIKPLEPVMVKKQFDKPVAKTKEPTKDENGIEAVDYDTVETETKEVESEYKRGVVLKVPYEYSQNMESDNWKAMPIKVGDVVVYYGKYARWFDLLKDSQLISGHEIVAVIEPKQQDEN